MKVALVVTTLGRIEPLGRLLDSLEGELAPDDRLVVVAQGMLDEVGRLVAGHPTLADRTSVTTSPRGAAAGRNAGVASLPAGDFLLVFPNDTTWFPPGALDAIRGAAGSSGVAAGAMTVVDENGPKFALPSPGTPLDRWNVWSVIEMGLLVRRALFDELGGFDPTIGTGAPTPWQAGEATDLLLRALDRHPVLASTFCWLPQEIAVGGVADPRGLSAAERRHKLRAYGRGLGRLVAVHRYPWWWRSAFVVGGLAFGLRHRATHRFADGWWAFTGRLEGVLGRTFGGDDRAVTR